MNSRLIEELNYINKRNRIYKELESELESKSYIKIEPDYFEDYDWFIKNNTRIQSEKMVKLLNPSGSVQLLRPDVTTNIIKQVLSVWENNSSLKLFYNATTFRQSKSGIKQSKQFGFEFLGDDSDQPEIEIIETIMSLFSRFNDDFILDIGNQKGIEDIIEGVALSAENILKLKNAIYSKNQDEINAILDEKTGDAVELLQSILTLNGSILTISKKVKTLSKNSYLSRLVEPLMNIMNNISEEYYSQIHIDLSMLSQFDYYSGLIFQGYLKQLPTPILTGGRYDKLTKQFGQEIPAVGASFDVQAYIKEVTNV